MKALIRGGFSAFMGIAMFATTFVPAPVVAMPLVKADIVQAGDVVQVQHRRGRHDSRNRNRHRHGHGWHNGHRGSRYHRRGYRRHSDGWWYPMAAFGAGAIIGGAIVNNNHNNRPRDGHQSAPCPVVLCALPLLPVLGQHVPAQQRAAAPVPLALFLRRFSGRPSGRPIPIK